MSAQAARVGLLAAECGQFAAFHRAPYAAPELTQEAITQAASKAGLSPEETKAAAFDGSRDHEFAKNEQLGSASGASGTPSFVIGNTVVSGAMRLDELTAAVEQAKKDL